MMQSTTSAHSSQWREFGGKGAIAVLKRYRSISLIRCNDRRFDAADSTQNLLNLDAIPSRTHKDLRLASCA